MKHQIFYLVCSRLNKRRTSTATSLAIAIFTLTVVSILRSGPKASLPSNTQEQVTTTSNTQEQVTTTSNTQEQVNATSNTQDQISAAILNLHVWHVCGFDVDSLRQWPFFPHTPDRQTFLYQAFFKEEKTALGLRAFGFLTAPLTGMYQFAISSDDGSEFWLSTDEHPSNVRLIAEVHDNNSYAWTKPGELRKYPTQISQNVYLRNGQKYFVEALHMNGVAAGHVMVLWKPPGTEEFSTITGQYLFPYCMDVHNCYGSGGKHSTIPSHLKPTPPEPLSNEHLQHYYNTTHFSREHLKAVLPVFPYHPSYLVKNISTYQGIWLAYEHMSSVYPGDTVKIIPRTAKFVGSRNELLPNPVLPKGEVEAVVRLVMAMLNSHHSRRFVLDKVIGVEGKEDSGKGMRYLLELRLYDKQDRKYLRLAEYVFRGKDGHLWIPEGLTWKRNATVHFIVPVKNQAKWVKFLVDELSKLYLRTQDENFRLFVIDFESTDSDVKKILENSLLSRKYTLMKKSGAFHKTLALQDAVASVRDPDSIVFLFDLHITLPVSILDSVRKHTIQGRTSFLPIVARLDCGFSPVKPKARWEEVGSGLVSVFKSDWDRFKGMDVEKFKTKWGGEDWDLLDRILRVGLESERLKIPGFYHYFHSKKGTWDQ